MNTKPIPIIITLAAAFISCVFSIVQRVEFSVFVRRLVLVVIIFLFMGTVIKMVLDYAFKTLEEQTPLDEAISGIDPELDDEEGEEGEFSSESQESGEGV